MKVKIGEKEQDKKEILKQKEKYEDFKFGIVSGTGLQLQFPFCYCLTIPALSPDILQVKTLTITWKLLENPSETIFNTAGISCKLQKLHKLYFNILMPHKPFQTIWIIMKPTEIT